MQKAVETNCRELHFTALLFTYSFSPTASKKHIYVSKIFLSELDNNRFEDISVVLDFFYFSINKV